MCQKQHRLRLNFSLGVRGPNLLCQNSIPSFSALLPLLVGLILFTPTLTAEKEERVRERERGRERVRQWGLNLEVVKEDGGRKVHQEKWTSGQGGWRGERLRTKGNRKELKKKKVLRIIFSHYSLARRFQSRYAAVLTLWLHYCRQTISKKLSKNMFSL